MAEDLLDTYLSRYGSTRTLFVTGELDVATVPAFERAVDGAIDGQGGEFCLDFSGLKFMDSTGARAVVRAYNKAPRQQTGRPLADPCSTPSVGHHGTRPSCRY